MRSLNKKIFPFKDIESKWVGKSFHKKDTNNYKYILEMLPYPSGNLHMGHVRNYTIVDILTRFYHLKNYHVIRPLGWDSFGLPAEMAAIERNIHPKDWTNHNIAHMKSSIEKLNYAIDWSHEISTCNFDYYKHQQKLFIEMYEKGYIIRKNDLINWDPVMKTVLANEQVIDGKGWRSGALVERKQITQWFFNISKYSEQLLNDIDTLENWPNPVKKMQKEWIGKYEGYIIEFDANINGKPLKLKAFTQKPYTIYGVSFLAVGLEFNCSLNNLEHGQIIGRAINPYSKLEIPVIVADYVINNHGTGVVMGVPAHDERDFKLAKQYNFQFIKIFNDKHCLINSNEFNGLTSQEALEKFEQHKFTGYQLRDWCISRQRYWGTPIPIIYCDNCGIVCSKEPVELPYDVKFDGMGNPLNSNENWLYTNCPKCNKKAKRETDTMDTFVDSSWYFLRYLCANDTEKPLDSTILNQYTPVNIYVGGIEHAILHLLYSRFFMIMLNDLGYVNHTKPFDTMITQGMVCYNSFKGINSGKYYYPSDIEEKDGKYYAEIEEVIKGSAEKMSKSLKNTIDPINMIETYGSDSLRLFIISDSPTDKDFFWNSNALFGCYKFMNKIWSMNYELKSKYELIDKQHDIKNDCKLFNNIINELNETINALQNYEMNIYVARLRMSFNMIDENIDNISNENMITIWRQFLLVLWSVCPCIASECYEIFFNENIDNQNLETIAISNNNEELTVIIQINGLFKKSYKTFDFNEKTNEEKSKKLLNIIFDYEILYIKNPKKHIINFIQRQ